MVMPIDPTGPVHVQCKNHWQTFWINLIRTKQKYGILMQILYCSKHKYNMSLLRTRNHNLTQAMVMPVDPIGPLHVQCMDHWQTF